ncbi:MAG TPA: helix-turn-helix domain-containing protein [Candidatus Dormibacteraeota bacterium]|nr:helix-turn-helix domain-containing protein [Candidatus Dormibacteraeota bacterium]
MITVKDVWRGALPQTAELLGGGAGLERRVEWATPLRTRPPAFEAIKGGEMAFIHVRGIRLLDERLDLAQVIRSFAEKGGVAAAVVGEVSSQAIEIAERMMLPLFSLPEGTHVADVQQATVRFILDQRTLLHERQQQLHTQLMELALAGAGTPAIVDRLAEITGRAVVWQDADGQVRHASPLAERQDVVPRIEADSAAVRRWAETVPAVAADPPVHEFDIPGTRLSRLVAPVPIREGIGGLISLIGDETELDQIARLAVARAASACAIELDRERAVLRAKDELEGEFLESLLTGTYSSEPAIRSRAERLNFDLSGDTVVLVARHEGDGSPRVRRDQLVLGAQGWIRRRAGGALAAVRQGALAAVLPLPPGAERPDIRRLAADLRLECAGAVGTGDVSVGVGRPKPGIPGVRASYREAEQGLTMGARLYGSGKVTAFADLGLHRLLFAMASQPELREFFDDQVSTLVEYDRRTGAGLMKTLSAYFHCHGSPTEIAQLLHLHRNTVLYRLRRIEEIGRLRLDDPQTRLNLHLCLKVREVLTATAQ